MKVDPLYMENLAEYVFDEKKFVTFKFLSVKLKVPVNDAKQMLYHFYDTEKAKGVNIYATYYLSGVASQKCISSLNYGQGDSDSKPKVGGDLLSQNSSASNISKDDKDAYLVLLCKDHELEEMKLKFSVLYSVHVYALSSSPSTNFDILTRAVQNPLRDDEGNAPVHYGGITCKAAFELREDPRLAPLLKNVQEVKANLEKVKVKHEQALSPIKKAAEKSIASPNKISKTGNTDSKKPNSIATNGGGDNRLKNMFATAASKPKAKEQVVTKQKDIVPAKKEINGREEASTKAYGKNKNKKNKKESPKYKEIPNRKRKRIRDSVFSSSDEEEDDTKMSEDEDDDTLPESPIPRKRIQIESDSDDDFKEEIPKKVVPPPVVEKSASGKRRVCKTIPKRHVDEEGFLVTVMEQVMVSESDNSDDEKDNADKPDDHTLQNKSPTSQKKEKAPPVASAIKDKKEFQKTTSSTATAAAKTKQASIMSFFQKK